MIKKAIFVLICIVLSLFLLTVAALGFLTARGYSLSVGRLLRCDNETNILVVDQSPICMSDRSKTQSLFENCQTGDLLFVLHDGVAETYPAQSGAFAVIRLKKGTVEDISNEMITTLTELGWLKK